MKHISNAVSIKINRLSSNKKSFDENKRIYNEALEKSGFQQRLEYQELFITNKVTGSSNNNNNNNSSRQVVIINLKIVAIVLILIIKK